MNFLRLTGLLGPPKTGVLSMMLVNKFQIFKISKVTKMYEDE